MYTVEIPRYYWTPRFEESVQEHPAYAYGYFSDIEQVATWCTEAYVHGYNALAMPDGSLFQFRAFIYPMTGDMMLTSWDDNPCQMFTDGMGYQIG